MARILVVDDDIDFLSMAALLLGTDGHEVTTAAHAEDALQAYQMARHNSSAFELILMDLAIPYTNGIAIAKRIREAGDWHTRIAFLTGHPMESLIEDSIMEALHRLKPCGIWSKPIGAAELIGNVRECLQEHNA